MSYNRKQKHKFGFTHMGKSSNTKVVRGFSDLQREVRSKLGMNQASTIWDTMKYMKNKPNNKVLPMRKQFYVREV